MTLNEIIRIMEMQEEILQFSHFTNADAWELGNIIVAHASKRRLPVTVSIRLNNGYTVFQYGFDGTNTMNEKWIAKKEKTVKTTEMSTLHLYMMMKKEEETPGEWFGNMKDYALCGGGFPIRVEEVGVIGSILVAGPDHVADHDLIVKCVSRYLHIDEVPRIRSGIFG